MKRYLALFLTVLIVLICVSCASTDKKEELSKENTMMQSKELNQLQKLVDNAHCTVAFSSDSTKFRVSSRGYSNNDKTIRANLDLTVSPADRYVQTDVNITCRHKASPGIVSASLTLNGQEFTFPTPAPENAKISGSGIVSEKITCTLDEEARKAFGKACSAENGVVVKIKASDSDYEFTLPQEALETFKSTLGVNNYLRSYYK